MPDYCCIICGYAGQPEVTLARDLTPSQRKMAAILDHVNGRDCGDEFRRWAINKNHGANK